VHDSTLGIKLPPARGLGTLSPSFLELFAGWGDTFLQVPSAGLDTKGPPSSCLRCARPPGFQPAEACQY